MEVIGETSEAQSFYIWHQNKPTQKQTQICSNSAGIIFPLSDMTAAMRGGLNWLSRRCITVRLWVSVLQSQPLCWTKAQRWLSGAGALYWLADPGSDGMNWVGNKQTACQDTLFFSVSVFEAAYGDSARTAGLMTRLLLNHCFLNESKKYHMRIHLKPYYTV